MKTRRLRKSKKVKKRQTRRKQHLTIQKGGRQITFNVYIGDEFIDTLTVQNGILGTDLFDTVLGFRGDRGQSPYDLLMRQQNGCPPYILWIERGGERFWFHSLHIEKRGRARFLVVHEMYDGSDAGYDINLNEGGNWGIFERDNADADQCRDSEPDPNNGENEENEENGEDIICFDLYTRNADTGIYDVPIDREFCVEKQITSIDLFPRFRDYNFGGLSPYNILAVHRKPAPNVDLLITQPDGQFLLEEDLIVQSFAIFRNHSERDNVIGVWDRIDITDDTDPDRLLSSDNPERVWEFVERERPPPPVMRARAPPAPDPRGDPLNIMLYQAIMEEREFFRGV